MLLKNIEFYDISVRNDGKSQSAVLSRFNARIWWRDKLLFINPFFGIFSLRQHGNKRIVFTSHALIEEGQNPMGTKFNFDSEFTSSFNLLSK